MLGSKLVLALGSKLVLVLGSKLVLVQGSSLVLVLRSRNYCGPNAAWPIDRHHCVDAVHGHHSGCYRRLRISRYHRTCGQRERLVQ